MSRFKSAGTTEHGYFEERLSAYLDGELTPREAEAVEQHLETCSDCQWNLETLGQTIQWTQELPTLTVPRVFTIPVPAEPERPTRRRWNLVPVLQGASALIAVLLVFAVAGDLIFSSLGVGSAPDAALQRAEAPSSAEVAAELAVEVTQEVEKAVEEPAAEPPMMMAVEATMVETVVETVVVESEAMVTATEAPLAATGPEDAWSGIEGETGEAERSLGTDMAPPPVGEEAVAGGGEPTLALPAPSALLSVTEPNTMAAQVAMAPEVERDEVEIAASLEAAASSEAGINWLRVLEYSLGGALVLLVAATVLLIIERRRAR
ncbi:MAG: zf-HC2 domain-containing protein [Anaerolineae bacterium]|jgi:predicted anti-sigma-YlaC factor YlaD